MTDNPFKDVNLLADKLFKGDEADIKTRVVLQNEVAQNVTNPGMAGKVGLIGAFPSDDQSVHEVRNYPEFLRVYGITESATTKNYDGVRAIGRLFMKDFPEIPGASSVVCVNICSAYSEQNSLTVEIYESNNSQLEQIERRLLQIEDELSQVDTEIEALSKKTNPTEKETQRLATLNAKHDNLEEEKTQLNDSKNDLTEIKNFYTAEAHQISSERLLTMDKLQTAFRKLSTEDMDMLFISSDLLDVTLERDPITKKEKYNTGHVYNALLEFIENKFTSHQPLSYVGWLKTREKADMTNNFTQYGTIGTSLINVYGSCTGSDLSGLVKYNEKTKEWDIDGTISEDANFKWGAYQIAQLFKKESYELGTSGLFVQGATINGEKVESMELAAHMCGWMAGMNVSQDLTYQTIPGVTGVNEELFFAPGDAGEVLNNMGIQVLKPKNRLDNTWYVNNSVNPSGWHTNHIRSINYLLKRFAFEAGLGLNNFSSNVALFRATLETVAREVLNEVPVIRSVTVGEPTVLSNYHLYVPVDIVLAGVITKISVGVSMSLEEPGTGSVVTTTGYNFYY